jgi:hypothetical protein
MGNREVSHAAGCAMSAVGEKGAHGGNRVSPVIARYYRAMGVETDV